MTKTQTAAERRRDDDFNAIMEGLGDAVAMAEGRAEAGTYRIHVPEEIDVKALRVREGLSQNAFAARYGFSASAIRQWEQKRRRPEATARILLRVIERERDAVNRALAT